MLLEMPPEVIQLILDACIAQNGLGSAAQLQLVCQTFKYGATRAIFNTRAIEGTCNIMEKYWAKKSLAKEYLYFWIRAKREPDNPLTLIFQETIDFLIEVQNTQDNEDKTSLYTRYLCHAAIDSARLPLRMLGTSSPKSARLGCRQIDHALAAATYMEWITPMKNLLALGAQPDWTLFGCPLKHAAQTANLDMLRILLTANHVRMEIWEHAVETSAFLGHLEVLQALVGFNTPNLSHQHYSSMLYKAARNGHVNMISWLLPKHAMFSNPANNPFPDQVSGSGAGDSPKLYWLESVIRQGCMFGQEQVVALALDHGAEPTPRFQHDARSYLIHAAAGGNERVLNLLLSQPMIMESEYFEKNVNDAFCRAISGGRLKIAKLLLEKGAEVNPQTIYRTVPYAHAAKYDQVDMLRFLIAQGAKLDFHSTVFKEALEEAQKKERTEIVNILQSQCMR